MDSGTMSETVERIDKCIVEHCFTQHVAVNVAKIIHMKRDSQLSASVTTCDIISIDGMGIVWGARLLGKKVPERVPGVELFEELLSLSANKGYPVYLLGATPHVIEKTVTEIKNKYKNINIAGYHHGYFWDDEKSIVDKIKSSKARLLFVAISSPKKEIFINNWKKQFGVDFVMGVGGTFDVISGKVRRAPKWMQKSGLEWLYRVIQEPRRMWKRYLVTNTIFAWIVLKEMLRKA